MENTTTLKEIASIRKGSLLVRYFLVKSTAPRNEQSLISVKTIAGIPYLKQSTLLRKVILWNSKE